MINIPSNYNELSQNERRLVREEYIKIQNGLCAHCGNNLKANASEEIMNKKINKKLFPKNFFNWPVHLHHNHKTGMTIGAVHCHCNAVLWQYYGE